MVEFKYHLSLYIRQFETILIDGRNLNEKLRFQITEAARNLHSEIEYVIFENSLETALELNKNQETPLPEEEIRKQYAAFDLLVWTGRCYGGKWLLAVCTGVSSLGTFRKAYSCRRDGWAVSNAFRRAESPIFTRGDSTESGLK